MTIEDSNKDTHIVGYLRVFEEQVDAQVLPDQLGVGGVGGTLSDVGEGVDTVLVVIASAVEGETNRTIPSSCQRPQIVQVGVLSVGRVGDGLQAVQISMRRLEKVLDDKEVALLVDTSFGFLVEAFDTGAKRTGRKSVGRS